MKKFLSSFFDIRELLRYYPSFAKLLILLALGMLCIVIIALIYHLLLAENNLSMPQSIAEMFLMLLKLGSFYRLILAAAVLSWILATAVLVWYFPDAKKSKDRLDTVEKLNLTISLLDLDQAKSAGLSIDSECMAVMMNMKRGSHLDTQVYVHHIFDASNGSKILPSSSYLSALFTGGPIGPVMTVENRSYVHSCPPNINIQLSNNNNNNITAKMVEFEVEKSWEDLTPIMIIAEDDRGWRPFHLLLINEGWGQAIDTKIEFNIAPVFVPQEYSNHLSWETWKRLDELLYEPPFLYEQNLGDIRSNILIDLTNEFNKEGLKADFNWFRAVVRNQFEVLDNIIYTGKDNYGKFRSGFGLVYGILSYKFLENGIHVPYSVKFASIVHLHYLRKSGAALPSSAQYETEFRTDGNNYKISLPISQQIPAGGADRFNVLAGAKKSSLHIFRVKMLFDDGNSVTSDPIEMRLFIPRSTSKYR